MTMDMRVTMCPLPSADVIAGLKPGDEVVIKTGFGHPPVKSNLTQTIAKTDQSSALTTDGIRLYYCDGMGVEHVNNY
jgi:hypothetical protein